jgi:hypothetical protein
MMTTTGASIELRAVGERAVLVGHDGQAEREVDPGTLALDADLSEGLHEWARVAAAVQRSTPPEGAGAAGAVVSRRGLQLAIRLAGAMGVAVGYVDPLTGEVSVVDPPDEEPEDVEQPARTSWLLAAPAGPSDEPVPWATGLTVSAFIFVLVLFAVLTLAITLGSTNPLLAVASNVVVSAGLLPSVWLVRKTPIWRWISYGVAAGIAAGWLALPFIVV